MESTQDIFAELKDISPILIDLQKIETFAVPAFYFDTLPTAIVNKIATDYEEQNYFTSEMPYIVSEKYFDTLAENIIDNIKKQQNESVSDELQTIAPLLNTIHKTPVYKVPQSYFETLTASPSQVKVVKLNAWKRYVTYAIAASIIGILGIGLYFFNVNNQKSTNAIAVSQQVKSLSEDELIQYITADVTNNNINATTFDKNSMENDLSKSLKQMTDKEIKQYLDECGEKVDI